MREAEEILNSVASRHFPYPDSAARVFEYMWHYSRNLHSLYETPVLDEEELGPDTKFSVRDYSSRTSKRQNSFVGNRI